MYFVELFDLIAFVILPSCLDNLKHLRSYFGMQTMEFRLVSFYAHADCEFAGNFFKKERFYLIIVGDTTTCLDHISHCSVYTLYWLIFHYCYALSLFHSFNLLCSFIVH